MPDISMCSNNACPLKEKCYRFKAIPNSRQSYGHFTYDEKEGCEYFDDIKNYDEKNN